MPDVDTVDLRNNRLTDGGVARMVRAAFDNRNVTSLDFSENQVSVEASAAIAHMLAAMAHLVAAIVHFFAGIAPVLAAFLSGFRRRVAFAIYLDICSCPSYGS